MLDFFQRLLVERDALAEKLTQLSKFIGSEKFSTLDAKDAFLLVEQQTHMQRYYDILVKRIDRLAQ